MLLDAQLTDSINVLEISDKVADFDSVSVGSLSSDEGGSCHSSDSAADDIDIDKQKHSLTIRVQKKILGKAFTKTFIGIIDEDTGVILNTLYSMIKYHTGNSTKAKKVVKYLIRILIKLGVFVRNNAFNDTENQLFAEFKTKYRTTALTFISFSEVNFTYDQQILMESFNDVFDLLKLLTKRHISTKSCERLEMVQDVLKDGVLLDGMFSNDDSNQLSKYLMPICTRLKILIDQGKI